MSLRWHVTRLERGNGQGEGGDRCSSLPAIARSWPCHALRVLVPTEASEVSLRWLASLVCLPLCLASQPAERPNECLHSFGKGPAPARSRSRPFAPCLAWQVQCECKCSRCFHCVALSSPLACACACACCCERRPRTRPFEPACVRATTPPSRPRPPPNGFILVSTHEATDLPDAQRRPTPKRKRSEAGEERNKGQTLLHWGEPSQPRSLQSCTHAVP